MVFGGMVESLLTTGSLKGWRLKAGISRPSIAQEDTHPLECRIHYTRRRSQQHEEALRNPWGVSGES